MSSSFDSSDYVDELLGPISYESSSGSRPELGEVDSFELNGVKADLDKKWYDVYQQAYTMAVRDVCKRGLLLQFSDNPEMLPEMAQPLQVLLNAKKSNAASKASKSYGFMVTVNPRPDVIYDDFIKLVLKSVSKKWLGYFIWCIEWRDGDTGMHAHIACVRGNKPWSAVKTEFSNTFQSVVGNDMHVKFTPYPTEEAFQNAISYVKGMKKLLPKKNALHDQANRKDLGLEDWYEK